MDQLEVFFNNMKEELQKRKKWNTNATYDDVNSVVKYLRSVNLNAVADKYQQLHDRIKNTAEVNALRKQSVRSAEINKDIADYNDVQRPEYKRSAAFTSGPSKEKISSALNSNTNELNSLKTEEYDIEELLDSGSITLEKRKDLSRRLSVVKSKIKDLSNTVAGLKIQSNIDTVNPESPEGSDVDFVPKTPTQALFNDISILANKFAVIGEELNNIQDPNERRSRQRALLTANYENEDKKFNKPRVDADADQATILKYNKNSGNFKTLVNNIKRQLVDSTNKSLLDYSSNLNWSTSDMKPTEKFYTDATAIYKLLTDGTDLNLSLGRDLQNKAKSAANRLKSIISDISKSEVGSKWDEYEANAITDIDPTDDASMLRKIVTDLRDFSEKISDRIPDIEINDYIRKIATAKDFSSVKKYIKTLDKRYANEMETDGHPLFKDILNRLNNIDNIRTSDAKIKHFFKKNSELFTPDQITNLKRKYLGTVDGFNKINKKPQ